MKFVSIFTIVAIVVAAPVVVGGVVVVVVVAAAAAAAAVVVAVVMAINHNYITTSFDKRYVRSKIYTRYRKNSVNLIFLSKKFGNSAFKPTRISVA
jgi:hypothetical protein